MFMGTIRAPTKAFDTWMEEARRDLRRVSSPEVYEAYLQAIPTDQAYAGLRRYWDKRQAAADEARAE